MKVIGIDLGTTNSVACSYSQGIAKLIKIDGHSTIPSVVFIDDNNTAVGNKAKKKILIEPEKVLVSTKRHIGTPWNKIINGKSYSSVDTASLILKHIKEKTSTEFNEKVEKVVVTIPAYFNEQQRADTKKAVKEAGLTLLKLLPEPTAAAIAYGLDKEKDQMILVFDLGGGTFDVSILEVKQNRFKTKAVDGNTNLGGDDFDNAIVEYLNNWIEESNGTSVRDDSTAQSKLKELAEETKIKLSQQQSTEIYLADVVGGISIEIEKFTRNEYKDLIKPYLDELVSKTNDVIFQADLGIEDINRIVLVGGSCKSPIIQDLVKERFKQPYVADDMDTIVAAGAAIVANSVVSPAEIEDFEFKDVVSHTLGVSMRDENTNMISIPVLKKNVHYPCKSAVMGFIDGQNGNQTSAIIDVLRGEHREVEKNKPLGQLVLEVTPKYISTFVLVACIFELDENGILTFSSVEIPQTVISEDDLTDVRNSFNQDENSIPLTQIEQLMKKYDFKSQKIVLKAE